MSDEQITPEAETPKAPVLLDRLRAKRAALGQEKTVTLEVPGYDGELGVRYRWKPYEELARKGQQLQKVKDPTRRDLLAAADTLIALCDEVLVKVADEWEPLAQDGDEPIRFGPELAEALGFSVTTARDAVFGTFQNDYAVLTQAMQLSAWLQDATQEVDSDFSGS